MLDSAGATEATGVPANSTRHRKCRLITLGYHQGDAPSRNRAPLDLGETAEGRPCLVMDYIDGVAIDVYSSELDLRGNFRLFLGDAMRSLMPVAT